MNFAKLQWSEVPAYVTLLEKGENAMGELRGRFAPSPSGRMHLGNLLAALLAWLDVRSQGGVMVLRIEDLDPQRCSLDKAAQLVEDLQWLGLDWDEGGLEPEYCQSRRWDHYEAAFRRLEELGLIYPCYCTRAERLAASAPHASDRAVPHWPAPVSVVTPVRPCSLA